MKKLRQIHFCCISVDDDVPNNDNCRRLLFRKAFYDKKSVLSYIDSVRSNLTPPSRNTVEVFFTQFKLGIVSRVHYTFLPVDDSTKKENLQRSH